MRELQRQIVVFGDFKQIDFNVLSGLQKEILVKYDFKMEAMPDQPILNQIPVGIPISLQVGIRPLLRSAKEGLSIFIGNSRMYIQQEQDKCESDYSLFSVNAIEIIKAITTKYSIDSFNRIAVNGFFEENDVIKIKSIYSSLFAKTRLFGIGSAEFMARVNNQIDDEKLSTKLNHIVSYNSGINTKTNDPTLVVSYDINTFVPNTKFFSVDDLDILIEEAKTYKGEISK